MTNNPENTSMKRKEIKKQNHPQPLSLKASINSSIPDNQFAGDMHRW